MRRSWPAWSTHCCTSTSGATAIIRSAELVGSSIHVDAELTSGLVVVLPHINSGASAHPLLAVHRGCVAKSVSTPACMQSDRTCSTPSVLKSHRCDLELAAGGRYPGLYILSAHANPAVRALVRAS